MKTDLFARIRDLLASEAVLIIAALAAIASMGILPFTPANATTYAGYIDLHTLGLLFSLMLVVTGFERAGLLDLVKTWLMGRMGSSRGLAFVLLNVVFFSSMLITNDVALLTFVPLALALFLNAGKRANIALVVALTVAANLGSAMTPIGNPQNIYLVSAFDIPVPTFFFTMFPLGVLSYICSVALVLFVPQGPIKPHEHHDAVVVDYKLAIVCAVLFALCLGCVAKLVSWQACTICCIAGAWLTDAKMLRSIDYSLLATFVCFFIFVGNLKQSDAVSSFLTSIITGRELVVSALTSQVVSNVPAAVMLSGFTDQGRELLLGTNIGGLGTPIASLASLISLRIYARMPHADTVRYLGWFTVANASLLAVLLLGATVLPILA